MADKAKGAFTPAQRRFVEEYVADGNGTRAYRVAYPNASYAAARTNAGRLLALPAVAREVRAGRAAQSRRTRVNADRVLREIGFTAFSDIGELFDSAGRPLPLDRLNPAARRAVAELHLTRVTSAGGVVTETLRVKFCDKLAALQLLARHFGLDRPLTPLEAVLQLFPPALRAQVVAALAAANGPPSREPSERDRG